MIRTLRYKVSADTKTVTPSTKQWGGMQYEDEATDVVFDISALKVENGLFRIDFNSAAAGYHPSDNLEVAYGKIARAIPKVITQYGGELQATAVITACDDNNEPIGVCYSFPVFIYLTEVQKSEHSSERVEKNISLMEQKVQQLAYESAEHASAAAESAETAKNVGDELKETVDNANTLIEDVENKLANGEFIGEPGKQGPQGEPGRDADTLKACVCGETVTVEDVSSIEHNVSCRVTSVNLLPYPYKDIGSGDVIEKNGVTFEDNGDGKITVDGTATAAITLGLGTISLEVGKTYTLSGCVGGGNSTYRLRLQDTSYSQTVTDIGSSARFVAEHTEYNVFIYIFADTYLENVVFSPQVVLGAEVKPFVPHISDFKSVTVERYGATYEEGYGSYTPNADGIIEGITSISPSMTFITDTAGAIIHLEYNRDLNKAVNHVESVAEELEEKLANGELKGEPGNSGVYLGSGDMPEDCNVQIDPDGEALTVDALKAEIAEMVLANFTDVSEVGQ